MITERDLVCVQAGSLADGRVDNGIASDMMSSPPITIDHRATLFESLVLCRSGHIRHLPVSNARGRLVGLVTQSDLMQAHLRMIEAQSESESESVERAVRERTDHLSAAIESLKAPFLEDHLLEIGNRKAVEVDLQYTHHTSLPYGSHYSVALFDLDNFQRYNDEHGRTSGDRALKRITAYVRSMVRKSDRLYRFGGDEIVVLLPETSLEGASILGRRIVDGAGELGLSTRLDRLDLVTISRGVTSVDAASAPAVRWRGVLDRADRALYQAKRQGKNRLAA